MGDGVIAAAQRTDRGDEAGKLYGDDDRHHQGNDHRRLLCADQQRDQQTEAGGAQDIEQRCRGEKHEAALERGAEIPGREQPQDACIDAGNADARKQFSGEKLGARDGGSAYVVNRAGLFLAHHG